METIPLLGISIWIIVKAFVLLGLLLYLAFAMVIIRQVQLMVETVEVGFQEAIKILAYVHLAFAVIVLILALIIL
jgi:hypothetical protein